MLKPLNNFNANDRATAEALEASEMLREFAATEIAEHAEEIKTYSCSQLVGRCFSSFSSIGRCGRVVSGMLKAEAAKGRVMPVRGHGRVSGSWTNYLMTESQAQAIVSRAAARGDRKAS